jgi:hypothetical protein
MNRRELMQAYGLIPCGKFIALVDIEDYAYVRAYEWKPHRRGNGNVIGYLRYKNADGLKTYYLHHTICGREHGPRPSADYACELINGDGLDCRRANLKWTLKSELKARYIAQGKAANAA